MTRLSSINYEIVSKQNLKKTLERRILNKQIFSEQSQEKKGFNGYKGNSIFMLEVPSEFYFETNMESLKYLLESGYKGIYLSFQRPFNNLCSSFKGNNVDINKLKIIDGATVLCGEKLNKNPQCIDIPENSEVSTILKAMFESIQNLKGEKKFVFIDSLSTLALYEPFKVTTFSEIFIDFFKKYPCDDVMFLFNFAKESSNTGFIKDFSEYADEFIHLGLCT